MTVKHDSMAALRQFNQADHKTKKALWRAYWKNRKTLQRRSKGDGEGKHVPPYIYMGPYPLTPPSFSRPPAIATYSIFWSSMLITPRGGWYYA